jgi:hypothetical protein
MCKYKAKYPFSPRHISLIFFGRFCALNFSVLRLTHRDCTLRAELDFRSIVTYLSIKNMKVREIYADMSGTLGADCIGYSTVMKYLREKVSRSQCLRRISSRKLKRKISLMKQFLGAFEECPFSSLRQIAKRILIPMSTVRYRLVNSLGYRIRTIRWVPH